MYPESLKYLIESFKYLPGIGDKTATRLAFSIMELSDEKAELFVESAKNVREKIHKCKICGNLTEDDICSICDDKFRNDSVLCVVEDVKNIYLFEKAGIYKGRYHVLGGLISPLDGINPEDIELDKLLDRIKHNKYEELILAFKPSVEGETTALYIKRILSDLNIKITKIASGIPMGADMEYVDDITLARSFNDRKDLE